MKASNSRPLLWEVAAVNADIHIDPMLRHLIVDSYEARKKATQVAEQNMKDPSNGKAGAEFAKDEGMRKGGRREPQGPRQGFRGGKREARPQGAPDPCCCQPGRAGSVRQAPRPPGQRAARRSLWRSTNFAPTAARRMDALVVTNTCTTAWSAAAARQSDCVARAVCSLDHGVPPRKAPGRSHHAAPFVPKRQLKDTSRTLSSLSKKGRLPRLRRKPSFRFASKPRVENRWIQHHVPAVSSFTALNWPSTRVES